MNLFFRLLWVFLRGRFGGKKIGLLDKSTLNYRVWLTDQDMFFHMTNSRYLSFSDLGTINYILRSGCWAPLRKRGWYPIICGQTMTISRMLRTPQKFQVVTYLTGWTDKYVGLMHEFRRNGRLHAEVKVIARFASQRKETVSPQDMLRVMNHPLESPELPKAYLDLIERIEASR